MDYTDRQGASIIAVEPVSYDEAKTEAQDMINLIIPTLYKT